MHGVVPLVTVQGAGLLRYLAKGFPSISKALSPLLVMAVPIGTGTEMMTELCRL